MNRICLMRVFLGLRSSSHSFGYLYPVNHCACQGVTEVEVACFFITIVFRSMTCLVTSSVHAYVRVICLTIVSL